MDDEDEMRLPAHVLREDARDQRAEADRACIDRRADERRAPRVVGRLELGQRRGRSPLREARREPGEEPGDE